MYWQPPSKAVQKNIPLSQAFSDIKGWKSDGSMPLNQRIVKSLQLDDYVNQKYSNGNEAVSLYIGYYLTTKKIGAAHDPLVCFPGQGWVLSNIHKGELSLNFEPDVAITYSIMIAQRNTEKQLIIYWFQSFDKTNSNTLSQKIVSFLKKVLNDREDNAFVRISVPFGEKSLSECREILFKFLRDFCPIFFNYVKQG